MRHIPETYVIGIGGACRKMYGAQLPARYRPLPMPMPAAKREPDPVPVPVDDLGQCFRFYMAVFAAGAVATVVIHLLAVAFDDTPPPRLFARLVEAEGLGLDDPRDRSPVFKLAVDVDMIPGETLFQPLPVVHVGGGGDDGGDDMDMLLRVTYRGVALAWGSLPRFTISQDLLGRSAAGVVTVVATAEASVLREGMRNLMWAELQALGRVEFEADGNIPGLGGHLHCKFYIFHEDDERIDQRDRLLPPCWVQKKSN